jgi:phage terminase large subunit-like protein
MVHGGNPVVRWAIDNLAVAMDPSGNVKPDKANAADKIDPVAALVNAKKECMDAEAAEVVNAPVGGPSVKPPPPSELFRPTGRLAL